MTAHVPDHSVATPVRVRLALLATIVVIYIGLPILIFANILPYDQKFAVLVAGGVAVYLVARLLGVANEEMGLQKALAGRSLLYTAPVTIALLAAAIGVFLTGGSRFVPTEGVWFYAFYILVSCPIQELLYRGVLPVAVARWSGGFVAQLIVSSALYSFVHVIYRDWPTLALTFVIGAIWFFLYSRARNLLGVAVSHIVLGVVTIATGLVN